MTLEYIVRKESKCIYQSQGYRENERKKERDFERVLSGLEVESSYAEGKDEGKKDGECN